MRATYGIDAPGLLAGFALGGAGLLALAAGLTIGLDAVWADRLAWVAGLLAVYPLGMAALMLYDSLHTKIVTAEMLLSRHRWTGAEEVLDVGCGRGLMLVRAALRLTTGHAIGVDLWRQQDQASNTPARTMANAQAEGVADRVTVETADMRNLPYPDDRFDVVVSNWVVHNLDAPVDRLRALSEMVRVLRPSGTLIVSDIVNRDEYRDALNGLGLIEPTIVVAHRFRDAVLRRVSFGSYQPAAVIGHKAASVRPPAGG